MIDQSFNVKVDGAIQALTAYVDGDVTTPPAPRVTATLYAKPSATIPSPRLRGEGEGEGLGD